MFLFLGQLLVHFLPPLFPFRNVYYMFLVYLAHYGEMEFVGLLAENGKEEWKALLVAQFKSIVYAAEYH